MENKELTSINGVEELTKKDVTKAYLRWHFVNEIPHSYERYLAPIKEPDCAHGTAIAIKIY